MSRRDDAGAGTPPEDVLERLRVPLIRRATLTLRGEVREAYTIDVGLRGVFVEWAEPVPAGEPVGVRFHIPEYDRPIEAQTRVVWWNPPGDTALARRLPGGLGLEFTEISEADRSRLRERVAAHYSGDLSVRRFHPAWPEAPGAGVRPTEE